MSSRARLVGLVLLVAVVASLPAIAGTGDTTTGLIGHWKLDETSGPTAIDSSPYGNDGAYSAQYDPVTDSVTGRIDRAANFNVDSNANVIATFLDELKTSKDVTISVWLKPVNSNCTIGTRGVIEISDFIVLRKRPASCLLQFSAMAWQNVGAWSGGTALTIVEGVWQHLAITYSYNDPVGTKPKVYVNGKAYIPPDLASASGSYVAPSSTDIFISRRYNSSSSAFPGLMDDVRLYNRVLTEDDVKALYVRSDKYCDNPTGVAGELRYNGDRSALQYCDGDNWVMMGLGSYTPVGVEFDGTNDWLSKSSALSGVADTKQVTGSVWIKTTSAVAGAPIIEVTPDPFSMYFVNGTVKTLAYNAADTLILDTYIGQGINDGNWHHILFSLDLSDPAKLHRYVDGAAYAGSNFTFTDDLIDFAGATGVSGSSALQRDLADFWIDFGTYIDFSSAAMRAKFISPTGMPMYLGDDGSLPTGSAPDVFLSGDVDNWHTNRGTGGGFTENGALTYASSQLFYVHTPSLTSGLIGHWKLDETSGTTAADSAGTNNGTMQGGMDAAVNTTTGRVATAMTFDGSNDYIDAGTDASLKPSLPVTVTGWVRFDSETLGAIFRSDFQENIYSGFWLGIQADTGGISVGFGDGDAAGPAGRRTKYKSEVLKAGVWHHVAGVIRGATDIDIYVDGVDVAGGYSGTGGAMVYGAGAANLGRMDSNAQSGNTDYFDGSLDDIRVYNRALTPDEIKTLAFSACENPAGTAGTIIFNTDHKVMQYCNGVDWVAMSKIGGTGGSGCASPAGVAGELRYTSVDEVMQYCNAEDWVALGKPVAPTDGLVSHWRLDETSGTTAFDSSPYGNDATYSVKYVPATDAIPGKLNRAANFKVDPNASASAPFLDELKNSKEFTVSAWVRLATDAHTAGATGIVEIGDFFVFQKMHTNRQIRLFTTSWDVTNVSVTGPALSENIWYHLAVTYSFDDPIGTGPKFYLNGQLAVSSSSAADGAYVAPTSATIFIGRRYNSSNAAFWGALDDIRLYNRVLSPGEITDLYNATR